jgi:hypothetical protein
VILVKGAYEVISAQREKGIAADYAAATSDIQLKAFIADNDSHVLGGLAQLRLADQAYTAGSYSDARVAYDKAAGILKKTSFGQRAHLGAAISAVQAGASADGEAALKLLSTDLGLEKIVRAEASYHLASLAATAGNGTEAIRLIEQVTVIDLQGQWAERASLLRATLPQTAAITPAADSAANAVPTISFK